MQFLFHPFKVLMRFSEMYGLTLSAYIKSTPNHVYLNKENPSTQFAIKHQELCV